MKKYLLLMTLLFLMGCSSVEEKMNEKAVKEIERGNYTKATFILKDAIDLNPNYLDGMVNYRNIYPIAVENTNNKIQEYNGERLYEREAGSYEDLLKLKEGLYNVEPIVHQKLGLSLKIPTLGEIEGIKKDAGISYYNAGNLYEDRRLNRYTKRERYFLYKRGSELNKSYLDIEDRREISHKDAMIYASFMKVGGNQSKTYTDSIEDKLGTIKEVVLEDNKLSDIVIFKDFNNETLRDYLNNIERLTEDQSNNLNTIIKVNLVEYSYLPPKIKKDYYTRYWTERYYVEENGIKVAKFRERSYLEVVYTKMNLGRVKLSYEMTDLVDRKTIGVGSFEGVYGDRYVWSEIIGRAPHGVRSGYERDIKSKGEVMKEATSRAINKLALDIRENI